MPGGAPKGNHNHLKHGMRGTRLYNIWKTMRQRCFNKNCNKFKNYGGRGITICPEWDEFQVFYDWAMANGYEDGLTIERVDVNGNYCPQNCTWIVPIQQSWNKTNTIWVNIDGKKVSASEYCYINGLSYKYVYYLCRKKGKSFEEAIEIERRRKAEVSDVINAYAV